MYALNGNDLELHDQLRISKSALLNRPDTLTVSKLRDVHGRLSGLGAGVLDGYGVTAADMAELEDRITVLEGLLVRPRTLIVERKGVNQDAIPGLLAELRAILYKMDSMVTLWEGTVFGTNYRDARIIVDLGGGGTGTPGCGEPPAEPVA